MPVDSKSRLAANDFSDWMKRQSAACSRKLWIAHGPASEKTWGCDSSPSSQKQSAERKAKRRVVRKLNITGSGDVVANAPSPSRRRGAAHESTVLVVPKSRPSERTPVSARS